MGKVSGGRTSIRPAGRQAFLRRSIFPPEADPLVAEDEAEIVPVGTLEFLINPIVC